MRRALKEDGRTFAEIAQSFDRDEWLKLRCILFKTCLVADSTIKNWKYGRKLPTEANRVAIMKALRRFGLETRLSTLWPDAMEERP